MDNTLKNIEDCPLVTIGITCFNAEDTIERAIKSALQQDWPNFEIVVVDDGSTDNSLYIIKKYLQINPCIRLFQHEKNGGFPSALNTIIENALGEFVAFFDDDDTSIPCRLSHQVKRIREYRQLSGNDLILCYSNRYVKIPGKSTIHLGLAVGRCAPEPHGMAVADYIFGIRYYSEYKWGVFGSGTMMAARSTLVQIGYFDESFRRNAEFDLTIRAAFLGVHFIAVDKPLMTQYKTFTSDKSKKKTLQYSLLLRKKYRDYLKSRHAYLSSMIYAYGNYFNSKNMRLLCLLCKIISSICYPQKMIYRIRNRLK
jgi:glycosyltransferase involved in cell wall biosynthesis